MIHHPLDPDVLSTKGTHWAAATNGRGKVLLQLGDEQGEQVRLALTPAQANEVVTALTHWASVADLETP